MPNPDLTSTLFPGVVPHLDEASLRMLAQPVERMLQLQSDMLKAAETAMGGWLQRRQEGAEAARAATDRLVACRGLNEALSIQGEWVAGAMCRMLTDLQALNDQGFTLSREVMSLWAAAPAVAEEAMRKAEWSVQKGSEAPAPAPRRARTPVTETATATVAAD